MQTPNESPYRLAFKNSVTVEYPNYMIRNPNTLVRNEHMKIGLSGQVDIEKEQPIKRTMVAQKVNQKNGYHKDTPFFIADSKTGQAAMEFHQGTKAVFSVESKDGKIKPNAPGASQIVPNKIFMKLCNAGTSEENQKRVMLLFNKSAQQTLMQQKESIKNMSFEMINQHFKQLTDANESYASQNNRSTHSRPQSRQNSNVRSHENTRMMKSTNKTLKGVDKEVLQFYSSNNSTSRDQQSSSLVKEIQKVPLPIPTAYVTTSSNSLERDTVQSKIPYTSLPSRFVNSSMRQTPQKQEGLQNNGFLILDEEDGEAQVISNQIRVKNYSHQRNRPENATVLSNKLRGIDSDSQSLGRLENATAIRETLQMTPDSTIRWQTPLQTQYEANQRVITANSRIRSSSVHPGINKGLMSSKGPNFGSKGTEYTFGGHNSTMGKSTSALTSASKSNYHKVMDEINMATMIKRDNLSEDKNMIMSKVFQMQRDQQAEIEQKIFSKRGSFARIQRVMEESRKPIKPRKLVQSDSKMSHSKYPNNSVFKMHNVIMGQDTPQIVSVPAMGMLRSDYGTPSMDPEDAELIHQNDSSKRMLVMKDGVKQEPQIVTSTKTLYKCASPSIDIRPHSQQVTQRNVARRHNNTEIKKEPDHALKQRLIKNAFTQGLPEAAGSSSDRNAKDRARVESAQISKTATDFFKRKSPHVYVEDFYDKKDIEVDGSQQESLDNQDIHTPYAGQALDNGSLSHLTMSDKVQLYNQLQKGSSVKSVHA